MTTSNPRYLRLVTHGQTKADSDPGVEAQTPRQPTEVLLQAHSFFLVVVEADGEVSLWSEGSAERFGLATCDVLGRPLDTLALGWDLQMLAPHLETARHRNVPTRLPVMGYTRTDSSPGLIGMTLNPIMEHDQPTGRYLLVGSDITHHRQEQQQRELSRRLQAMGEFTAGLAHEVNTPVQFIGTNLRFIQESMVEVRRLMKAYEQLAATARRVDNQEIQSAVAAVDDVRREVDSGHMVHEIPPAIEESLEGIEWVTNIVRALRRLAHPDHRQLAPVAIEEVIDHAVTITRHAWKYHAELSWERSSNLPTVNAAEGPLTQVFVNLLMNAAQAIVAVREGQGTLAPMGRIRVHAGASKDGQHIEVRITDSGGGIPKDVQPQIFQPFFTTKPVGEGTGQGLALAHTIIVHQHGGTITCQSTPDQGTTFTVTLPCQPAPADD